MNASPRVISMDSIPSVVSMLLRAATSRKKKQGEVELLPLKIVAPGIHVNPGKLQKFREVCAFPASESLPLTYPHIMAFALHMQLMLEPEFPFSPIGAVHIRNRIRQQRPLGVKETLDFEVSLQSAERVAKGYEFSIVTEVSVAGEPVWDDLSVMLVRKGGTGERKDKSSGSGDDRKPTAAYTDSVQWQLAANMGRQYAAASGDYNPIHLYPLTARLMGFKRQIMHGMWSKSRCVAHLLPNGHAGAVTADVAFKLPIYLPATVTLLSGSDDTGSQFELKDADGEKPHLVGTIARGSDRDRSA